MAIFSRRNKTEDSVPTISSSFQTTASERVGIAWLLAFAALVITVIVATALAFGGRWAWRAVFNDDLANEAATDQQIDVDLSATVPAVSGEIEPNEEAAAVDNSVDNDVDNDATTEPADTNTNSVNALPAELPNTGPDLDL